MNIEPHFLEEGRQVLRHTFFLGVEGAPARASAYSGVGSLRGWVRASIIRAAIRARRQPKGRISTDQATLHEVASPANDLELDYLKRRYGLAARDALREAFGQLEVRERNLLRQHFGLGLGLDALGQFYGVHRATAARRLARARAELAERTRDVLAKRLHLATRDISSILRIVQSQLEDVVRDLFRSNSPDLRETEAPPTK
jgi:RNA polymerase sigma-70 factor (ECF subfamily)